MGPTSVRPFFSYLVHPAEDLPGQWIGHCLELGLVTQGDSLRDALDSICDSLSIVLAEGDVSLYKRTPPAFWSLFLDVITNGKRMELGEIPTPGGEPMVLAGYLIPNPQVCAPKVWELPAKSAHGPPQLQA